MGIAYGVTTNFQATKGIVQDGLIFNLDFGTKESYSSGTSCYDIKNNNTGAINNSPAFSKAKGGGFLFDGTNEYINFTDPGTGFYGSDEFSVCVWAYPTLTNGWTTFVRSVSQYYSSSNWDLGPTQWGYGRLVLQSGGTSASDVVGSTVMSANNWYYACMSRDSSGVDLYLNNNLEASNQSWNPSSQRVIGGVTYDSDLDIGKGGSYSYTSAYQGIISCIQIYNRGITAAEVSRNFNVMRHRFGI